MSDTDWSGITARTTTRLRAPKITPVPAAIVRLAQASLDGVPGPDGQPQHVLEHEFDTPERAASFAKLMRHAGNWTVPVSTVSVVIDPDADQHDEDGKLVPLNPGLVRWKAGGRRGQRVVE